MPAVEFQEPGDPSAVLCLDRPNVNNLLIRDIKIEGHIRKLEAALQNCR